MTERPILFNAEMVRAVLAGTKTQTRRVVKPQPTSAGLVWREHDGFAAWVDESLLLDEWSEAGGACMRRCPYGEVGDRLWVREAFQHYANHWISGDTHVTSCVKYRADDTSMHQGVWADFPDAPREAWWNTGRQPWRPSIHMPRWASRIMLELTEVRVERVRDISYGDAGAEGVDENEWPCNCATDDCVKIDGQPLCDIYMKSGESAVGVFGMLWDSINSKSGFGWETNCWVWVVSFKRINSMEDSA